MTAKIGDAFKQWRDLQEVKGMKTCAEVALFLLDRCTTLVLQVSHNQ